MKVAIYCRLSEEDKDKQDKKDDSESIQNQKSLLVQYAVDRSWEIYNIYSDDDYTGSDRNRPAFNQLLADAENKKFDIVLCKSQSRFTREMELVEKYIHTLFPIWGIRFISVVDNADTDNKGNKKARQINGLINEWYLEDMSENIKSVLTNKRKNGNHIGAFALYGYKKDPKQKGHLIIDEPAAEIVREVFNLFASGYGKTNIARLLNARGLPNPTEYKRLNGLRYSQPKRKEATLWKYFAISDMLVNEIYIGHMVQGKYGSVSFKTKQNKPVPKDKWIKVENTHEPIIDMDLWNRVQELVKLKVKPFIVGNIGIFSKKTKCKTCGYTLRSKKCHGNYYLECSTRSIDKNSCIGAFVPVKELKEFVIYKLQELLNDYLDKDKFNKKVSEPVNNPQSEYYEKIEISIAEYNKQIANFEKGIRDLYFDKVKELINEEQFLEYSRDFHNDKHKLEKLVAELQDEVDTHNKKSQANTDLLQLADEYSNITDLDRETVDRLIDCIYVGRRNPETNEFVDIHWYF
ncbi:MAG: recombinase family protein [Oscillospiraceae bacterium]|nr:recombinase family protein [Oscillospiraceae bacterium]